MTAQAAPRTIKSQPAKPAEKKSPAKDALYAVEEHSLAGFLEGEPDLHTVTDIKVRYQ